MHRKIAVIQVYCSSQVCCSQTRYSDRWDNRHIPQKAIILVPIIDDEYRIIGIVSSGYLSPRYLKKREMYGTNLPAIIKLVQAGARVCIVGSFICLLLVPKNYQMCPHGVRRIGWIAITVVPNNEVRSLNIYYTYADALL